jgi:hypothetical protein
MYKYIIQPNSHTNYEDNVGNAEHGFPILVYKLCKGETND